MKRILPLLALLAACSTAPAGDTAPAPATQTAPALNPVGTFTFSADYNGQAIPGSVTVSGGPGAYTATIRTSMTPDLPGATVAVEGQQVTITASTDNGPLEFRMNFSGGDTFTGTWSWGMSAGSLTGRRGT